MTDQPLDRELLIELITKEVLSTLASQLDRCDTPEGVRHVVTNGADRVAFHGDASLVPIDLAKYIDHTALKPETTADDIDQLCQEAAQYQFASVCVNPTWVKRAAAQPPRHRREGLLRHRVPARCEHRRDQGHGGAPGHPRRSARSRHGRSTSAPSSRATTPRCSPTSRRWSTRPTKPA